MLLSLAILVMMMLTNLDAGVNAEAAAVDSHKSWDQFLKMPDQGKMKQSGKLFRCDKY